MFIKINEKNNNHYQVRKQQVMNEMLIKTGLKRSIEIKNIAK